MHEFDKVLNKTTSPKVDVLNEVLSFINRDDFKNKTFEGVVEYIAGHKNILEAMVEGEE